MNLKICISNENQEEYDYLYRLYSEHSTFHEGDSGLDLFFPNDVVIQPNETVRINLGISCSATKNNINLNNNNNIEIIELPTSWYMYPRSSISNTSLRMSNSVGIIDAGYRGNLMVSLDNIKSEPYFIEKGTRLFQICSPDLSPINFEIVNNLDSTDRGSNGFGSTN